MATKMKDGFRATERDLEMVVFGGRHRGVEGRQFAERFGMHLSNAHRRLGGLVRRGLLDHRRLLHGRPGIYIATSAGLDFVGLELPPARLDLRSYEHDVELVWLALELEREFGAAAVVTEREIRSAEMPAAWDSYRTGARLRPRHAVPTGSSGARRGLHFPDLVVEGGAPRGGSLAVELERTSKGSARRREIVAGYRDATQFEQVRYYGTAETLRGIERSVAEERANKIERVFDLRAWHPRAAIGLAPVWLASSLVHQHHHGHPGHHRHHGVASQPVPFEPLTHWLNHVMPSALGATALSVTALALVIGASRLRWTWCVPRAWPQWGSPPWSLRFRSRVWPVRRSRRRRAESCFGGASATTRSMAGRGGAERGSGASMARSRCCARRASADASRPDRSARSTSVVRAGGGAPGSAPGHGWPLASRASAAGRCGCASRSWPSTC